MSLHHYRLRAGKRKPGESERLWLPTLRPFPSLRCLHIPPGPSLDSSRSTYCLPYSGGRKGFPGDFPYSCHLRNRSFLQLCSHKRNVRQRRRYPFRLLFHHSDDVASSYSSCIPGDLPSFLACVGCLFLYLPGRSGKDTLDHYPLQEDEVA